jgi:tRNA U55 pseudouridine synthase TruB
MTSLVRVRSGIFRLSDTISLEELSRERDNAVQGPWLMTMDGALGDIPAVTLDEEASGRIRHGNSVAAPEAQERVLVRVHDANGRLLALARESAGEIRPETVFC